jgi:hypothetical protein
MGKVRTPPEEIARRRNIVRRSESWAEAGRELGMGPKAIWNFADCHRFTDQLGADVGGPLYGSKGGRDNASREATPKDEAERQARTLVQYWARQGYSICARVIRNGDGYEVRSDLINGLPRDWKGRAA